MTSRIHHTLRAVRWTAMALLLIVGGVALGMGARSVLLPLLPMKLAMLLGAEHSMQPSGGAESGRDVVFWKSSMIPNFVSPQPGLDPMGMDLIPVYRDQLSQEKYIALSPEVMTNIGLRTESVKQSLSQSSVRTFGQVEYAEPLLGDVTLKVEGWVEEILVDFVGQRVERGQPLFRVYSPDLVTAQQEYLLGLQGQASAIDRLGAELPRFDAVLSAQDKLRYWNVPESELLELQRTGKAKRAITFESPFQGWVIEKHAYQGMHMMPGKVFYRIADLSTVWMYAYVYEYQLPRVQAGQPARLTLPFLPGEVFHGKVIYVYPDVDTKTRQIRARLEFSNPDQHLKPGMFADVAYVQVEPAKLEPREVTLGEDVQGGQVRVLDGLKANEEVVVSGQFLLDSERRVKEANLRMLTQTGKQSEPTQADPEATHDR